MTDTLIDVVRQLDSIPRAARYEIGPAIFARRPLAPDADALILVEEVIDGSAPSAPGYSYVLDVEVAIEVLNVWTSWRDGDTPTDAQAAEAVIYYAMNDAYQPTR